MKRVLVIISLSLFLAVGLLLSFAPDTIALLMTGLMVLVICWGYFFGIYPTLTYMNGFSNGRVKLEEAQYVQADSMWLVVAGMESLFQQKTLDKLFSEYRDKVTKQEDGESVVSDIVEYINEDALALRSWQNVIQQIPGTVTALGLLGTFVGLIIGISSIGFSTVEAALGSIEVLLSGIQTAFYTSIAGVIFSILFNLIYRLIWNSMLREMGLFVEEFHRNVMPSLDEQLRDKEQQNTRLIMEKLDRLSNRNPFEGSQSIGEGASLGEHRLMPEIQEGLQRGEFIFHVQPRYDLNRKQVVAGEIFLRWNHREMGIVPAAYFLPLVERNGFVVRLDRYIWEEVCKTIRHWIDSGYRPLPLSVHVTKTDVLALELAECFDELIRKYRIPPRYLEIEIAENAYLECEEAVREVETMLRQRGFHIIVGGVRGDLNELTMLQTIHPDAIKVDLRNTQLTNDHFKEGLQDVFEKINLLNIPVIAYGIESAAQVSVLRSCGCAEGQGIYFSKALPLEEFEDLAGYTK